MGKEIQVDIHEKHDWRDAVIVKVNGEDKDCPTSLTVKLINDNESSEAQKEINVNLGDVR